MPATYDSRAVALSIVIASIAAYLALSLGERVTANRGPARMFWLLGGASAMGTGIWSMHFTGMLAFHLPVPIGYDISTVVISLVAAIISSGVALAVVSQPELDLRTWLGGGVVMGSGIAVMHYTGMAAMRLAAVARWDLRIIAASIAIAVIVSLVALWLVFHLRAVSQRHFEWRRAAAAGVMGIAIAGMHYTGMAAATFLSAAPPRAAGPILSAAALGGTAIALVTLFVLVLTLAVVYVDRRFVAHELALGESKSHFRAVVASAPVLLFALDADGLITMAQGRDLSRVGAHSENSVGRSFFAVFAAVGDWLEQANRAFADEAFTAVTDVNGAVIEMRWMPVRGADGVLTGLIAVGTDITERRRAEEALEHQAFHDDLTGLANRLALNERLTRTLEHGRTTNAPVALAVLDLNRFKHVNDTLGHDVGDLLLQQVGIRVRSVLHEGDFFARIGGDEFAVINEGGTYADCADLARRIGVALEAPFLVDGHSLEIGAALGLALSPTHATDAAALLRCADVAMYAAKRAGLGYALYDSFHDSHSSERLTMESDLRRAIAQDELVLHYQPTVELATGCVIKVEALVRWRHPTLGLLAPDRFIPMAEETGLILPLTHWVLDTALRQVRLWDERGVNLRVAVNLSTRALYDPTLPSCLERRLLAYGVAPHRLTLEVTETTLMSDIAIARVILMQLKALGTSISIDDFGTGYSSLQYLKQLPVDEIKIDKAFVIGMRSGGKDAAIVRCVNGLGKILGLRVVAEGVETAEALETLVALGCDVAQGYYISRPLPADRISVWIAESSWAVRSAVA